MKVKFITLSGRQRYTDSFGEVLDRAAKDANCGRIAFAGRTSLGRSGIAIDLHEKKITGHKIHPIPERLLNLVRHVPLGQAREGIELFAKGIDVLIGTKNHGLVLRWNGPGFDIFGAGDDSV